MLKDPRLEAIAPLVDWVEAHNARVVGGTATSGRPAFALEMGLPGIAVSDAHSVVEVGVAYTALDGDPSTAEGLLAALTTVSLVPGRASYIVRTLTPIAKLVNRARGNRRVDQQPVRRHGCALMSEPPVPDADATPVIPATNPLARAGRVAPALAPRRR